MSFQNKNLSVLAYANGFTLWRYTTDDVLSEVLLDVYFVPGKSLMCVGDIILINCAEGGTFRRIKEINSGVTLETLV